MNDKLNIEELFKSKLEEMEYTPSPKVWKQTSRALRRREFIRPNPRRFNIFYSVAIILVGSIIALSITNRVAKSKEQEAKNIPSGVEVIDTPEPRLPSRRGELVEPAAEKQLKGESITKTNKETLTGQSTSEEIQGEELISPSPVLPLSQSNNSENNEIKEVSTLIAFFTPSVYEGCVPLEVEFINSSINAESFTWNFGAVGSGQWAVGSEQWAVGSGQSEVGSGQRAVNVYNEAGTYTITLIATDENGLTLSHSEQITVHPNPTADFEIADGDIYNYSTGAESYTWKLLREDSQRARKESNSISTDFQPALSSIALAKEGHLTPDASYLTLISTNSYGCSDTTLHILPLSPSPSLRFPNAFSPNPNGSIGGYYNANEPNNQIFYPKHAEKPSSYNLQIFNKVGELIFETNEIEIGWDGYYKEAHSAQGVYIYQCTGTWKNGDSYNYRGDITILWTEN